MQLFHLNVKENRRAAKCDILVEKQEHFSIQSCCSQPVKTLRFMTAKTESYLVISSFCLASLYENQRPPYLPKKSVKFVGTYSFRGGKENVGFKKFLKIVWTALFTSFLSMQ